MQEVKDYIKHEINQGSIKKGQRLPSCREIAKLLSVNKITVNKAYKSLENDHLLYSIPRGGYYCIGNDDNSIIPNKFFDFSTVKPDPSLLPYLAFTHAMNHAIEEHKHTLFEYESPMGFLPLRETLMEKLTENGIYTSTNQIMITNGAQEAIYLSLKTLFQNPSCGSLLVESPTYGLVLDIAKSLHINCIGVTRDQTGINTKELEQILKNEKIKAFYIIPRHHNPTGYSLSEKNKNSIVKLCSLYHVTIIEDDYLADLGIDKRNLPLHYYDTNQITLYIRSFSKTFMPGLRLGAVIIPDILISSMKSEKYLLGLNTSSLSQASLDFFIRSGMYDKHIKKVNTCYRKKLEKARKILSSICFDEISYHVPNIGLFIWIMLPESVSSQQIIKKLAQKNILVSSPNQFYLNHQRKKSIRLCISGIPISDLSSLKMIVDEIQDDLCQNSVPVK